MQLNYCKKVNSKNNTATDKAEPSETSNLLATVPSPCLRQ